MTTLSEATILALSQVGWHEGRRVDTTAWEHFLKSEGYTVHPIVIDFLSSYGGLTIGTRIGDELTLDPTIPDICVENVEEYEEWANTKLCPVGAKNDGYVAVLFCDSERSQ